MLEDVLNRKIEWVDWSKLPSEERKAWSADAEVVLRNRAFISLCGKTVGDEKTNGELVKFLIEYGIRRAKDYEELQGVRMTINGIELIREHLESMIYEEPKETKEDLTSPI